MNDEPKPFEKSLLIDEMPREKEDLLKQFFALPPDISEIYLSFCLWSFVMGASVQLFIALMPQLGEIFWLPVLPFFLLLFSAGYCQHKHPELQIDLTVRIISLGLGMGLGII